MSNSPLRPTARKIIMSERHGFGGTIATRAILLADKHYLLA